MNRTPIMRCWLQSIENKACMCRPARPPADYTAGIEIYHQGEIGEGFVGPEWSKKRNGASPPRTVLALFSAYGSLLKLGHGHRNVIVVRRDGTAVFSPEDVWVFLRIAPPDQ